MDKDTKSISIAINLDIYVKTNFFNTKLTQIEHLKSTFEELCLKDKRYVYVK